MGLTLATLNTGPPMSITLNAPAAILFIKDLQLPDGKQTLIQEIFPPTISHLILNIPILDQEQDTLVWAPSMTGKFTVIEWLVLFTGL